MGTLAEMKEAARELQALGARMVLVKGGHLEANSPPPRPPAVQSHSGPQRCTLGKDVQAELRRWEGEGRNSAMVEEFLIVPAGGDGEMKVHGGLGGVGRRKPAKLEDLWWGYSSERHQDDCRVP